MKSLIVTQGNEEVLGQFINVVMGGSLVTMGW
jgi:hypothetical protein